MGDDIVTGTNKNVPGYYWKICPYSTQWSLPTKLSIEVGGVPVGGGPFVPANWKDPSQRTDHTTYEGRMFMKSAPRPGFICRDDNCYYYTTISSGSRYFEI